MTVMTPSFFDNLSEFLLKNGILARILYIDSPSLDTMKLCNPSYIRDDPWFSMRPTVIIVRNRIDFFNNRDQWENLRMTTRAFDERCILVHDQANSPDISQMCTELDMIPCYVNIGLIEGLARFADQFWHLSTTDASIANKEPLLKYKFSYVNRKTTGEYQFRQPVANFLSKFPKHDIRLVHGESERIKINAIGHEIGNDEFNHNHDLSTGYYHNVFCPIIPETRFDGPVVFSEKIARPLIHMRPFVAVSSQFTLSTLRSYGFKTFDRWFDETYDILLDPEERMAAILKLIEQINTMSIAKMEKMIVEMKDVLVHNHKNAHMESRVILRDEMKSNIEAAVDKLKNRPVNGWVIERVKGCDDTRQFFSNPINHSIETVMNAMAVGDNRKMDEYIGYHLIQSFGLTSGSSTEIMNAISVVKT